MNENLKFIGFTLLKKTDLLVKIFNNYTDLNPSAYFRLLKFKFGIIKLKPIVILGQRKIVPLIKRGSVITVSNYRQTRLYYPCISRLM